MKRQQASEREKKNCNQAPAAKLDFALANQRHYYSIIHYYSIKNIWAISSYSPSSSWLSSFFSSFLVY